VGPLGFFSRLGFPALVCVDLAPHFRLCEALAFSVGSIRRVNARLSP